MRPAEPKSAQTVTEFNAESPFVETLIEGLIMAILVKIPETIFPALRDISASDQAVTTLNRLELFFIIGVPLLGASSYWIIYWRYDWPGLAVFIVIWVSIAAYLPMVSVGWVPLLGGVGSIVAFWLVKRGANQPNRRVR